MGILIEQYLQKVDLQIVNPKDYGKWIKFRESYPPIPSKPFEDTMIEILHEGNPYFHSVFHDGEEVRLLDPDWTNELFEWELPEVMDDYWRFIPDPPGNESYDCG